MPQSDQRPADILGESHPLGKVFSSDYVFTIPNYQRPYAWTTEESEELLDDVLGFLGDDPETDATPIRDLRPYFLGSVVLIKRPHVAGATVVDGQQRLTTLTLLFALLRDLAATPGERAELAPFVHEAGSFTLGTEPQPRLTLRDRDAEFFRRHVQTEDQLAGIAQAKTANDAQRNLQGNAVRLRERLGSLPQAVRSRLGAYLAQRCFLVVVSTPDRGSAYRIFSVLNDRGLDLTAADILKAEVIGALATDPVAEAEYTARWESTEEALGRDRFLELFGHIRTIHQKVKRKEALLDEVQKYVRPAERPRPFIDDELVPYSEVFTQAREATFGERDSPDPAVRSVNRSLRWLGRVDNADWLPVAMVLLRHFRGDLPLLDVAVRRLERLASAMMVYRANANVRLERYAAILTHLEGERGEAGVPLWTGRPVADGSPLDLRPEEQGWALDALDGDVYAVTRTRRFILLRLNDALTDDAATRYHLPVVTVEHVLPQNPKEGSGWYDDFPDAETRAGYVHKMGNLVLLSRHRNSAAGRLPFARKKAEYFGTDSSSAFVLTAKVLAHDTWTPDVIEERQADLIGVLAQAWDLDLNAWHRGAESTTDAGTVDKSVLGYLARSSPQTRALFERIDDRLRALGDDVERKDYKTILSYRREAGGHIVASVKVQPATGTVVLYLPLDPNSVDLRPGFTRDVSGIGRHGAGGLEVRVQTDDDLRAVEPLLRASYEPAS